MREAMALQREQGRPDDPATGWLALDAAKQEAHALNRAWRSAGFSSVQTDRARGLSGRRHRSSPATAEEGQPAVARIDRALAHARTGRQVPAPYTLPQENSFSSGR